MVSIAESLIDNSADVGVHNRSDAVPLLREAINLFKKCLTLQRGQLLEVDDTSITSGRSTADFTPQSHLSTQAETEQRWATVVETITSTTLFDTYLAEAHAWTTLVPLLDPNFPSYQDTESNSMAVLNQAATTISLEEERITYQQATFNLKSILADYAYRSGIIPSIEYIKVVSDLWLSSDQILSFGPGLCDYADALIIMNTSLAFDHTPGIATFRWQALAEALKSLAQANTNSGSADRIAINTRRADVELLRTRLGDPPIFLEQATKNRAVLIKNAETYYLGARRLAQAENDDSTANTMLSKSIIAKALLEENMNQLLAGLSVVDTERLQVVIGEMIEEGLISS